MKLHSSLRTRFLAVLLGVGALVAGHAVALYYASSHAAVSSAMLLGAIALVAVKHVSLLGTASALLRRRLARTRPK